MITTAHPSQKIKLRPHVKTHKCKEGAFIQAFLKGHEDYDSHITTTPADDVVGFVASTIPEMEMLYECAKRFQTLKPFGNVLYGIPISSSKMQRIVELKRKFDDLQEELTDEKFDTDKDNTHKNGIKKNNVELHVLVDNIGQVQMLEKFSSEENKLSV